MSQPASHTEPLVVAGAVIAYRLFDVAYAIDLAKAEAAWARQRRSTSTRARLSATPPKAMAFGVPPVEIMLEPIALRLGSASLTADVTARLYDFGVVTISVRLPVRRLAWSLFVEQVNAMDAGSGDTLWRTLLAQVTTTFKDALDRPSPSTIEEDYLIAVGRFLRRAVDQRTAAATHRSGPASVWRAAPAVGRRHVMICCGSASPTTRTIWWC